MVKLSPNIFWDVEYRDLDYSEHAHFIISRVATRGSLKDWLEIKQHYTLEKIRKVLVTTRNLDKISLNFFSSYFNIPKEKFRCYSFQQLNPEHWNF